MAHSQFTLSVNVCFLFAVVPEALACAEDDGYMRCSDVLLAEGSVSFQMTDGSLCWPNLNLALQAEPAWEESLSVSLIIKT